MRQLMKEKIIQWSFNQLEKRKKSCPYSFIEDERENKLVSFVVEDERGAFDIDIGSYKNGVAETRVFHEKQLVARTPLLLDSFRVNAFRITIRYGNRVKQYRSLVSFLCFDSTRLAGLWYRYTFPINRPA